MQRTTAGMLAGIGLALAACPARADAIDGHWCHADGRYFSINGSEIVTPTGSRTTGNYSRHAFSYAASAGLVAMTLVNENTVNLRVGGGAVEVWRRCQPPNA